MKRRKIFEYIVRDLMKHPEAQILPAWGVALHWLLFPLLSLRYWNDGRNGYDVRSDTWRIHGLKFTGSYFYRMGQVGRTFKVVSVGEDGTITLQELV